jgi:molybdate transport system substrate-binding protein
MPRPSLVLFAALTLAACGSTQDTPGPAPDGASAVSGTVTVFAAASLTETFTALGEEFEAANPATTVTFNFAGSSALAQQITQGAPVDVFAAASPAGMEVVTDAGSVTAAPTVFVRNKLQIAVPRGNPAGITGLADFAEEANAIALCAEQVPCGAAARKAFTAAGITPEPDTLEQDVKAALTKVRLGEVDAALVYETDVKAAGADVEGIAFPEAEQAINDYPIAALAEAPNPGGAAAFIAFVLSEKGRAKLTEAGFTAP